LHQGRNEGGGERENRRRFKKKPAKSWACERKKKEGKHHESRNQIKGAVRSPLKRASSRGPFQKKGRKKWTKRGEENTKTWDGQGSENKGKKERRHGPKRGEGRATLKSRDGNSSSQREGGGGSEAWGGSDLG